MHRWRITAYIDRMFGDFQIRAAVSCLRTPIRMAQTQNAGSSMEQPTAPPHAGNARRYSHSGRAGLVSSRYVRPHCVIQKPVSLVFSQKNWKPRPTQTHMCVCSGFTHSRQPWQHPKHPFVSEEMDKQRSKLTTALFGAREIWDIKSRDRHAVIAFYCFEKHSD